MNNDAIKILEEVIQECDQLKKKCFDSIRRLQGGVYHEVENSRPTGAGARRLKQIKKQIQEP